MCVCVKEREREKERESKCYLWIKLCMKVRKREATGCGQKCFLNGFERIFMAGFFQPNIRTEYKLRLNICLAFVHFRVRNSQSLLYKTPSSNTVFLNRRDLEAFLPGLKLFLKL
jgi:hypothetical protein